MLPGKTYAPEDFVAIALRRKWAIILPFVIIALGTIVVAHFLPNRYRSETVILVVPQQVPESYVRSTITSKIEDRLQSISQQILSRTRLERIIQDFNLYERERQVGIMEDVVQTMRSRDIRVDTLKGDAFRIAFIGDNPLTVMRVTDRLASHFIDENLRDREILAQGTSQFLTVQLEDARRRLVEQEKKLEEYRLRHSGELPSQAAGNLQQVQNLQLQVQNVIESLNRDVDRKLIIERALADLKAADVQAVASAAPAAPGDNSDQPVTVQIAAAEKYLSELQLRLTPRAPRCHSAEAQNCRPQGEGGSRSAGSAACHRNQQHPGRRPRFFSAIASARCSSSWRASIGRLPTNARKSRDSARWPPAIRLESRLFPRVKPS